MSGVFFAVALADLWSSSVAGPESRWASHIEEASARCGVPISWIERVIQVESGGRTKLNGRPIRSHAGAMGLMQLMPETWRAMQRAHELGIDPDDPHDNIIAGTCYLRLMYDRFGYPGLFAAYNAGPARYAAHLAVGRSLPKETTAYLAAVSDTATRPSHDARRTTSALLFAIQYREAERDHAPPEPAKPNLFSVFASSR